MHSYKKKKIKVEVYINNSLHIRKLETVLKHFFKNVSFFYAYLYDRKLKIIKMNNFLVVRRIN